METDFDVIVVGAGHAGCEAAHAAARMGARVLLTAIDLKSIAYVACNPSIGGVGKSHLVYEIDALGGLMGRVADAACIQMRTLNRGKGPAVQALRAQIDKYEYHATMRKILEATPNLTIKECEVAEILTTPSPSEAPLHKGGEPCSHEKSSHPLWKGGTSVASDGVVKIRGVQLSTGEIINCRAIIVATGVYLNSKTMVGDTVKNSGPAGFDNATHLTKSLVNLGLEIRRFSTTTPPRVDAATIDYAKTTPQPGDSDAHFSFMTTMPARNVIQCHLTYTNEKTHEIIRSNIKKSAMYNGLVDAGGPRYCPSIEDKVTRFAHNPRHQIFLEPESLSTNEVYLQGLFTAMPLKVQKQFVQSIDGLERAAIVQEAYAIEYDCINSLQLFPTLEYKDCRGLFFAGQINGTSGYEEAAAQGLVAGINAAGGTGTRKNAETCAVRGGAGARTGGVRGGTRRIFSRTNSYIGVLIDDLVTVGTTEPYRMFTSRAEHRLFLRQDNADQRLTPLGREIGVVDDERWHAFQEKLRLLDQARKQITPIGGVGGHPPQILEIIDIEKKYAGYLAREQARIAETRRHEQMVLPRNFDYNQIPALRSESREKLNKIQPQNLAQAMRISGVTPADINVLLVWFRKRKENT